MRQPRVDASASHVERQTTGLDEMQASGEADRLPGRSCVGRRKAVSRVGAPARDSIANLRRQCDLADYMGYCPHRREGHMRCGTRDGRTLSRRRRLDPRLLVVRSRRATTEPWAPRNGAKAARGALLSAQSSEPWAMARSSWPTQSGSARPEVTIIASGSRWRPAPRETFVGWHGRGLPNRRSGRAASGLGRLGGLWRSIAVIPLVLQTGTVLPSAVSTLPVASVWGEEMGPAKPE